MIIITLLKIFNRTIQNENAEDEIRQLQAKIEILMSENKKANAKATSQNETPKEPVNYINYIIIEMD